jgi:GT2 family glycosyltransferase
MKKEFCNIGILSYNRLNYTKQCIEAIHETLKNNQYPFKITVVDNGSTDGSVEYLKNLYRYDRIQNLCLNPKNVGVAKGANACWTKEPDAMFFLKLDNDMVAQKQCWLDTMILAMKTCPVQIATLGYNVEPTSYPVTHEYTVFENTELNMNIRIGLRVKHANIGGACILIPERTETLIGHFNEAYSTYGEEDADYNVRLGFRGYRNAYMEDEDAFFHLPAGKAAVIDTSTPDFHASDGSEEINEKEYRDFKDSFRGVNVPKFFANVEKYRADSRTTYIKSNAKSDFRFRWMK